MPVKTPKGCDDDYMESTPKLICRDPLQSRLGPDGSWSVSGWFWQARPCLAKLGSCPIQASPVWLRSAWIGSAQLGLARVGLRADLLL